MGACAGCVVVRRGGGRAETTCAGGGKENCGRRWQTVVADSGKGCAPPLASASPPARALWTARRPAHAYGVEEAKGFPSRGGGRTNGTA